MFEAVETDVVGWNVKFLQVKSGITEVASMGSPRGMQMYIPSLTAKQVEKFRCFPLGMSPDLKRVPSV